MEQGNQRIIKFKKKLLNEFNENTANADITKVEIVVDIDEF